MQAVTVPVQELLAQNGLLRNDARLLCAVSGGADSMALLHALCRLRAQHGFALLAVHVQHGLRGEDSLADEAFVRRSCRELDVELLVEQAALDGGMEDAGAETRARDCRRAIFAEAMRRTGAHALLVAHHRDDQAETVLMHLLRGAGADGLRGMRQSVPFGGGLLLRPLLGLPKRALLSALEGEGLAHREDMSNQLPLTPRNALRLQTLPALERLFADAGAHIAQAADSLGADADCLEEMAADAFARVLYDAPPVLALRLQPLMQLPQAVGRRVLRRWYAYGLQACGAAVQERALSHDDTLALMQLLHGAAGQGVNLPCGLRALRGGRYVHLLRQSGEPVCGADNAQALAVASGQSRYELCGVTVEQFVQQDGACPPADACEAVLPPHVLAMGPVLRTPRAGDRLHPMGATGAKPLRRWMTDRRIDRPLRSSVVLLAVGSDVLWIPGMCTAEGLRMTAPEAGSVRLRLVGDAPYVP